MDPDLYFSSKYYFLFNNFIILTKNKKKKLREKDINGMFTKFWNIKAIINFKS